MDTLLAIVDFVTLITFLVVIPVCFLKGRPGFAWFGIIMFGTGVALSFQGFRYVRDGLVDDWWWWVFNAQGVAVLVLLVSVALRAPELGSRWDRRNSHKSNSEGGLDRI